MLKKFPFGDTLLKDLEVLQHDKTATFSVSTVVKLAKRFPQLCLDSSDDMDSLREEFLDFTLAPTVLPTLCTGEQGS